MHIIQNRHHANRPVEQSHVISTNHDSEGHTTSDMFPDMLLVEVGAVLNVSISLRGKANRTILALRSFRHVLRGRAAIGALAECGGVDAVEVAR